MSNATIFRLARNVVEAHERRSSAPGVEVIPVLLTTHGHELEVFKSVCAMLDGTFIDSEADDYPGPLTGTVIDVTLEEAVKAAFRVTGGPRPRELEIHDLPGRGRDVLFDGSVDVVSASGGEKAALHLARALLRPELRAKEFAVVVYREDGMDWVVQDGAWTLTVNQLSGMQVGHLRTLVVVVQPKDGWVNPDVHCKPEQGFRYALIGEEYLLRNTPEQFRGRVNQIVRSTAPPVFFLGAGFSKSSGIPLGNTLRDRAITTLLGPGNSGKTSDELAFAFRNLVEGTLEGLERTMSAEDFARTLTFERVIREEHVRFRDTMPTLRELANLDAAAVAAPGVAVSALHEVVRRGRRVVILTVNLDTLIESELTDQVRVFASDDEFEGASTYLEQFLRGEENRVPVLKLHGTITDFTTCVVNDETTRLGIGRGKRAALDALVGSENSTRSWTYVGASMRDLDLREYFRSHDFARGTDETWVAPHLVSTVREYEDLRLPHWRRNNPRATLQDHLITESADSFFHELNRQWT